MVVLFLAIIALGMTLYWQIRQMKAVAGYVFVHKNYYKIFIGIAIYHIYPSNGALFTGLYWPLESLGGLLSIVSLQSLRVEFT